MACCSPKACGTRGLGHRVAGAPSAAFGQRSSGAAARVPGSGQLRQLTDGFGVAARRPGHLSRLEFRHPHASSGAARGRVSGLRSRHRSSGSAYHAPEASAKPSTRRGAAARRDWAAPKPMEPWARDAPVDLQPTHSSYCSTTSPAKVYCLRARFASGDPRTAARIKDINSDQGPLVNFVDTRRWLLARRATSRSGQWPHP